MIRRPYRPIPIRKPDRATSAIGCAAVTAIVVIFAAWCVGGYVAYHFISKAW